jgi:hypothetical protein
MPPTDMIFLRNEFATLEVCRDDCANGPRLLVRDLETGREIFLDLLEVESLTRMSHDDFVAGVTPD